MAKTRRLITAQLGVCDGVVIVLDARAPDASSDPTVDELIGEKPRIYVLNKASLADPAVTSGWLDFFRGLGHKCAAIDCFTGEGISVYNKLVKEMLTEKIKKNEQRGMSGRELTLMVLGVPNTGKSTFINKLTGKKRAKAEDRAGVTRDIGRFKGDGFCFLDTPGVLWPKIDDPSVGYRLAMIGSVRDEILDKEDVASRLCSFFALNYPGALIDRYKIADPDPVDGFALLETIAKKRGMLVRGGDADTLRAAETVLDEFRGGKLGRISLEAPDGKF